MTLPTCYPVAEGPAGMERAIDDACRAASRAVWDGASIVVLSDRGVDAAHAPVPPLLAVAAVHSHLVREGARTMCGLVVESGEPRETMHFALLLGYGAAAVTPYLVLETLAPADRGRYLDGVCAGLLKVCSKMGISTVQSYRGAQIFEAVGLGDALVERYFPGTVSRLGGIGLRELHAAAAARHARAFADPAAAEELEVGGEYRYRRGGEHHVWEPEPIVRLQRAVRDGSHATFLDYAREVDGRAARLATLRGLLEPTAVGAPLPLEDVEPSSAIVRRFVTGAMSLGSISPEAHETLAIAMNRLGGRSNTGEGGEDPARSIPDANGDLRRSAIKQVASGRFGVTAAYLVDADQLQIKIAQGAKPGEGGQLPGGKITETIARLRHSTPGVGLISPPPHHDIYSIEDLGPARPRPQVREPAARRSRSSSWPRRASARSRPGWPRRRPSTSSSPATTAARVRRRSRRSSTPACRGSWGSPRRTRCSSGTGFATGSRCRSTAACARAATCWSRRSWGRRSSASRRPRSWRQGA